MSSQAHVQTVSSNPYPLITCLETVETMESNHSVCVCVCACVCVCVCVYMSVSVYMSVYMRRFTGDEMASSSLEVVVTVVPNKRTVTATFPVQH